MPDESHGDKTLLTFYKTLSFSFLAMSVKLVVMALEGGPQPGGVVHPPNPRGWLLGDTQAIRQIYS